jgi:hypothetical protein
MSEHCKSSEMKLIFSVFLWKAFLAVSFNPGYVAAQGVDEVQGRLTARQHKVSSGILKEKETFH